MTSKIIPVRSCRLIYRSLSTCPNHLCPYCTTRMGGGVRRPRVHAVQCSSGVVRARAAQLCSHQQPAIACTVPPLRLKSRQETGGTRSGGISEGSLQRTRPVCNLQPRQRCFTLNVCLRTLMCWQCGPTLSACQCPLENGRPAHTLRTAHGTLHTAT